MSMRKGRWGKVSLFLFLAILLTGFFSVTSVYALSIKNHLITDDPRQGTGCTTPTAKTAFTPNDSKVYFWVHVSNAVPQDTLIFRWYAPDNSFYSSVQAAPSFSGSGCMWNSIPVNGAPAADMPGTWRVELHVNGALVTSDTFVIGNPALSAPQNLRFTLNGDIITIEWDTVSGAAGYKAGLGVQSGNYAAPADLGNITRVGPVSLAGTPPGTYYIAVKAYNGNQESAYSNEIAVTIAPEAAVPAPQNLRFTLNGDIITIDWDTVSGAAGYKAGLGVQSGNYAAPADLGNITRVGPVSLAGTPPGTYYIAVKAYNGNQESAYSNEIAVTISADQNALIEANGNPDYLMILFNSDPQRREEIWVYTKLRQTHLFWDGRRIKEQSMTPGPSLYFNPPFVTPSLFTKDTQITDLVRLFGSNYSVVELSSIDPEFSGINFKTYFFKDKGVNASFYDDRLVVVQSDDLPKSASVNNSIQGLNENVAGKSAKPVTVHSRQRDRSINSLIIMTIYTALRNQPSGDQENVLSVEAFTCVINDNVEDCRTALKNIVKKFGAKETMNLVTQGFYGLLGATDLLMPPQLKGSYTGEFNTTVTCHTTDYQKDACNLKIKISGNVTVDIINEQKESYSGSAALTGRMDLSHVIPCEGAFTLEFDRKTLIAGTSPDMTWSSSLTESGFPTLTFKGKMTEVSISGDLFIDCTYLNELQSISGGLSIPLTLQKTSQAAEASK
ncbi:MAG: hypothetical protein HZB33_12785 [Nitrospirae bacterium]|nr:hypothetical protein [Nitrospirota bacterium]